MDFIFKGLENWFREVLGSFVAFLLQGMAQLMDGVTKEVSEQIGHTPETWSNAYASYGGKGIFQTIENIGNNVIVPIGGIILSFVVMYEFIQQLIEKNTFHEFEMGIFFRFIFKTVIAIVFLSNTFTIVNAIFDLGNEISTSVTAEMTGGAPSGTYIQTALKEVIGKFDPNDPEGNCIVTDPDKVSIGALLLDIIVVGLLDLVALVMQICSYVIVIGRMIEVYIYTSVAPIPLATVTNRDFGDVGKNYLKNIFAFALQGVFIMICVGIFQTLIITQFSGAVSDDIIGLDFTLAMLKCGGLGIVLILSMFKSGSMAKSILGCH
ncbi:MAG: CD0415/CD1112 family protein [Eubacterium sp.]|nr:CD0415/CD1112 family protein [Eubacterium sp.]